MDACLQDEIYNVLNYWIHGDKWIPNLIKMSHLEKLCVQSFDIWIVGYMGIDVHKTNF